MNKNASAVILIILAIAIYFSFTKAKIVELKSIQAVNQQYEDALIKAEELIKKRDEVLNAYNAISPEDRDRLSKMLPDNIDNIRLIIDTNGVASRHGLNLKGIKTSAEANKSNTTVSTDENAPKLGYTFDKVTISFSVSTNYLTFIAFLKDLEASLRIMDVTKITLSGNDTGIYDYGVELQTYWLKQ